MNDWKIDILWMLNYLVNLDTLTIVQSFYAKSYSSRNKAATQAILLFLLCS